MRHRFFVAFFLFIFIKKMYERRPVDNYGSRRCCKYRRKPAFQITYPHYPQPERGKLSSLAVDIFSKKDDISAPLTIFYTFSTLSTSTKTPVFISPEPETSCFLFKMSVLKWGLPKGIEKFSTVCRTQTNCSNFYREPGIIG